jgi:malignant T-cell-amplified sequence
VTQLCIHIHEQKILDYNRTAHCTLHSSPPLLLIMFKKFDHSNDVSTSTQVKSSIQRALKSQILEQHPAISEEILEELLPKKSPLVQYKVGPHLMLYCRRIEHEDRVPTDEPVLFQHRDGPILPTVKLVHQYPTVHFTRVTVDKGAIPFLLGGANIMCPGLTNPGSEMPVDDTTTDAHGFDVPVPGLAKGAGVVIYAEGKEYAIGVGAMTMSSVDVYVRNAHVALELSKYDEARDPGAAVCYTPKRVIVCVSSRLWFAILLSICVSLATIQCRREKNKGIGCEVMHFLGDGLYQTEEI